MKKTLITLGFCAGLIGAVEAAPSDVVTQADLQALKALIEQQNAKIEAQAKRIAELEGKAGVVATTSSEAGARVITPGEGTETNETGRIWTMGDGRKFYLADATAGIFNPLTESGLQFEPYGYLVLEAVHNTHGTDLPMYTDYVRPRSNRYVKNHNGDHTSTLSVNDWASSSSRLNPTTGGRPAVSLSSTWLATTPTTRTSTFVTCTGRLSMRAVGSSSSVRTGISGRWSRRRRSMGPGWRTLVIRTAAARRSA